MTEQEIRDRKQLLALQVFYLQVKQLIDELGVDLVLLDK